MSNQGYHVLFKGQKFQIKFARNGEIVAKDFRRDCSVYILK